MYITTKTIESDGFINRNMFHPKAGLHPSGRIHLAIQTIGSGDYFGPVEYSFSDDHGQNWSKPAAIPELGWIKQENSPAEYQGVCDTVVNHDPQHDCMVFLGHSVFYKDDRFMDTQGTWNKEDTAPELRRRGCYSVLLPDGSWTPRALLEPPEFANHVIFMCGCGQRIVHKNGEWLIAFYGRESLATPYCFVTVCRLKFNGRKFEFIERGNLLELHNNRGLLEPSLLEFGGQTLITLRAEDGHAYWSKSSDGLHYDPIQPWKFDDGTFLETSSTQQHWLFKQDKLFLSYTRKNEVNSQLVRFRAPLYIAEVNPLTMELIKSTEQVVFPIEGDLNKPSEVLLSGNFMPLQIKDGRWIITDGQCMSAAPFISKFKVAFIDL